MGIEKLKMQSQNNINENINKIAELFPNTITEIKDDNGTIKQVIDFEILKQELSDYVVTEKAERYQFTWPEKRKAILLANKPINATLRPNIVESLSKDGTTIGKFDSENLYIEGDNLDVLKLLQQTYMNKVKVIYIDPPYNTGNDFVYEDNFFTPINDYFDKSGQVDNSGNILFQNKESNGRFHTDWLNMMYPRLKLAKNLLTEDGVIFISIDEHEIFNLIKIGNEIFGEANHIGEIIVKSNPRGSMSTSEIASLHEYLVIYSKNRNYTSIIGHLLSENMTEEYKYIDNNGNYRLLGLRMRGGFWRRTDRPKLYYPIYVNPKNLSVSTVKDSEYTEEVLPIQPSTLEEGTWRWSKEKVQNDNILLIAKKVKRNEDYCWDIFQKDYLNKYDNPRRTKAKSIWDESEINYQNGATEIKKLFNKSGIFDYSKPVYLIKKIFEMINFQENDIVLDFFSGSATTADAVMQFNKDNIKKLKYILVQIPEKCNEKSEAFKSGYTNICDIGKERIKRVANQLAKDNQTNNLDLGFRVLKLDSTNMKDVFYTSTEIIQTNLDGLIENIKEDRNEYDLLFQIMLELAIPLSSEIKKLAINNKNVFNVDNHLLDACFDSQIDNDLITEIAKNKPYYFVMRDTSILDDSTVTNFEQIFKTYSPDTKRKVL